MERLRYQSHPRWGGFCLGTEFFISQEERLPQDTPTIVQWSSTAGHLAWRQGCWIGLTSEFILETLSALSLTVHMVYSFFFFCVPWWVGALRD